MRKKCLIFVPLLASWGGIVWKAKKEGRSISSKFAEIALKLIPFKDPETKEEIEKARLKSTQPYTLPSSVKKRYLVEESTRYLNTYILKSQVKQSDTIILYFHGGTYWYQPAFVHFKFVRKLVDKTNSTAIFPIYPKGPAYTAEDVYQMIYPIYLDLIDKQHILPENIIFMGDSAGGGLALAFAEYIKTKNKPTPRDIILISPWLDLSNDNPEIEELKSVEPLLDADRTRKMGEIYAGSLSVKDFRVSPIFGNFSDVGHISLYQGTHDLLLADSRKLAALAKERGIPLDYYEYPKMNHVFPLVPIPEAEDVINKIVATINRSR